MHQTLEPDVGHNEGSRLPDFGQNRLIIGSPPLHFIADHDGGGAGQSFVAMHEHFARRILIEALVHEVVCRLEIIQDVALRPILHFVDEQIAELVLKVLFKVPPDGDDVSDPVALQQIQILCGDG